MIKKIILSIIIMVVVTLITMFSLIYFDFFQNNFKPVEKAMVFESQAIKIEQPKEILKVMTWNIKFGAGRIDFFFDCHGNREVMTKEEVIKNVDALSKKIKEINPDILFLQELDIDSNRSDFVNQIQQILDNTDLNYGAFASQWKSKLVPSNNIKQINSGNAILSKYELKDATRYSLPLMTNVDFLTKYFYLKRNYLKTYIELNNKKIYLLNIHAEAYSSDGTKEKQLDIFFEELENIKKSGEIFIAGGDFNTLPPYSTKTGKFDDQVCGKGMFDDSGVKKDVNYLEKYYKLYNFETPLDKYKENNKTYFTHTTDKKGFWNRKLDYILTNGTFIENSSITHQNTMELSDHAPISVDFQVK